MSENEEQRPMTYGEKAVGLTFNHAEGEVAEHVTTAKSKCAEAIDMMYILRDRSNNPETDYPLGSSPERAALATIAIRSLQAAQMAMVKAITWKD